MKMFLHKTVRSNRRWSHAKQTRPAVQVDPAMHTIQNVHLEANEQYRQSLV